jgi:hypothetical protein
MPVFFTPFMITRLALMADLSSPISVPAEKTVAPISAPVETETVVETETAEPVEKTESVEPVEKTVASMKMTKAQLQELATARNIKFAKSWNKTKLVEAINA